MQARFRLLEMVDGLAHVAEVEVIVELADRHEVVVSDDAFTWLVDAYGPNAVVDRPVNSQLVAEALAGVRHGLDRLGRNDVGYRVTVTRIWDTPADTSPGDVKAAATQALYLALGLQPDPAPRGKTIV
jgi:hypothetical protein